MAPQTLTNTSKASSVVFYVAVAMLVLLLILVAISIFKTNSLSANMRDECSCTSVAGDCKFVASVKDEFSLNKYLNYGMLAITLIVIIMLIVRHFTLG
jgi:hypothetical protein